MSNDDVCASSGAPIPSHGCVRCVCGRVWESHDKQGEPRFTVPLHTPRGEVAECKVSARLERAWEVLQRRDRVRKAMVEESKQKWAR